MFDIDSKNKIKITKGDTAIFDISVKDYNFVEGDIVYFTVKYTIDDESNVIQKVIKKFDNNIAKIVLDKNDTNVEVGSYLYDVQFSLSNGIVNTVIPPTKFVVEGGVTHD